MQVYEGKIVGREFVVAARNTTALLDLVEEALEVARSTSIGAEACWFLTISFRRDVCPRALLADERPDPVGVISSICQQYRLRK